MGLTWLPTASSNPAPVPSPAGVQPVTLALSRCLPALAFNQPLWFSNASWASLPPLRVMAVHSSFLSSIAWAEQTFLKPWWKPLPCILRACPLSTMWTKLLGFVAGLRCSPAPFCYCFSLGSWTRETGGYFPAENLFSTIPSSVFLLSHESASLQAEAFDRSVCFYGIFVPV